MTAYIWSRLLIPVSLLCLCGGLSQEILTPSGAKDKGMQGDEVSSTLSKIPETGKPKKSLSCYEDDRRFSAIISRDAWDEKKMKLYTIQPTQYIVVRDGGKRCKTHAECLVSLSEEMRQADDPECRLADNFYIGGNGEVYEGRGWYAAPFWHLHGMRRRAVTVKFLGSHESEGPSERTLRAFWRMAKDGVWGGRLSADYHALSMGQVYNDSTLVGGALERVFQESSVRIKEFNMLVTWEITPDKGLPLIPRNEWGAKRPTKSLPKIEFRAAYIIIYEGGERCFTPEDCESRVRAEQEQQLPTYGDVIDNFYIGDDGYVYEGRGFKTKSLWDIDFGNENRNLFRPEYVTIKFFGNFQSDHPSEKAIGAFKLLANGGFWATDDYKLYSLRDVYNNSQFLGDGFYDIARKWNAWASELDDRFAGESPKEEFSGLVKRSDWEASEPSKEFGSIRHPVDYVIINGLSDSGTCLNSKECKNLLKEIQENEREDYGDLKDNFYVSDNGKVYEGRGWNNEPHFQTKYFNKSLITINFLGSHKERGASIASLAAFENFIRIGVELGKIAPNYQIYSSRNVYDAPDMLGDGFNDYFLNTKQWSKKLDTLTENERWDSEVLPIVRQGEWPAVSAIATYHPYSDPVQYVVIGSTGDRCFTHDECSDIIKEGQTRNLTNSRGFLDNFYIGDNGLAYEGRGWNFAPTSYLEVFKSQFYYVTFFRQYGEVAPPSTLSVAAFNRLMENGVRTQKLSPNFKIISIHQIFDSEAASEDMLYKNIKTWDRWSSEFTAWPKDMPSGHDVFVSRVGWHAEKPSRQVPIMGHPLGYIIVHNVGDHCIDLYTCTRSLQAIQKNTPAKHWDVPDNFYIGDDGHIYEGRGWDHSSLWGVKGIDDNFISVGFLGSFDSYPPSQKALLAFHTLQKIGIILGKLSPTHKVFSLGEILKEKIVVSEKLVGALQAITYWSDDIDLKYDNARLQSLYSPFVLSDEWNLAKLPVKSYAQMPLPIKYVAIRDGGASCNTSDACVERIMKEHVDRHAKAEGGVAENFYIGDDGNVYEGKGWDKDMSWGFTGWLQTVSVQFFGEYKNDLPSTKALEAFNTVIIRDGIETGKLSPYYKIVPIPEGDGRTLGRKLREEIMTWKNAVENIE
ncbi:uncharacterized protein [Hetaerina americana]|uniref:uncharacterized protein n=1 Tax=Hetaerina americana TaxID=62018 RepID=UPI003A7F32FB